MKTLLLSFVTATLVLSGYSGYLYADTQDVPSAVVEGSIYSYREDDVPEVFFFPKERARWDGTRVTMREWYMLTDLQKERFVSEYLGELKKQYNGAMEILGLDYLNALNVFSEYANEKIQRQPSAKVIDLLLEGQGKSPTNSQ
ncbi:MAG: hypothetical protein PHS46_01145 [Candidatus Omnitrophica bacterium]|nr:hypothetical protein [Candidatus Omnitrophota bacterium]